MNKIHNQESVGKDISHLFRSISIFVGRELEPYGIGSAQFPFLMLLLHEDGVSQEQLANSIKCDRATSARSIARLLDAGYVRREVDPTDRRAYRVFLTEHGIDMRHVLLSISTELNNILMAGFKNEEKLFFTDMIQKAAMNIAKENESKKECR